MCLLSQLIDPLVIDIVSSNPAPRVRMHINAYTPYQFQITEELVKRGSAVQGLALLGQGHHLHRNTHERSEGRLEDGEGSQPSGTYAKTC
jgi:hypothetical protein